MQKSKVLLTLCCVFSFAMGCSRGPVRVLDEAERCVRDSAEVALTTIEGIDKNDLHCRKDKARYDFLYAMALNRLRRDTISVEFLSPAIDYFRRHKQEDYLMQALYCQGRIYANNGNWPRALVCFKGSEQLAGDSGDNWFKVLLFSSIRQLYYSNYDNKSCLEYTQKTLDAVNAYGINEAWKREEILSLANVLENSGLHDQADSLFVVAFNILDTEDVTVRELLHGVRCSMLKKNLDARRGASYFERALKKGARPGTAEYYQYCYALTLLGRNEEAAQILDSLRALPPTIDSDFWNYKLSRHQKDYESAMEYCEDFCTGKVDDILSKNSESVHKAEAEWRGLMADLETAKAERTRLLLLVVVVVSVLTIMVVILLFRRRKALMITEIDKYQELAETSESLLSIARMDLDKTQGEFAALRKSLCSLYQTQLAEIGRIVNDNLFLSDNGTIDKKILEKNTAKIEKILVDIRKREKGQKGFEKELNEHLDNLILKLRADFPELNEKDYLFISYMAARFDSSTIAFLTDLTKNNIRVKASRYRKLILSRQTPNMELYRMVFQKHYTGESIA